MATTPVSWLSSSRRRCPFFLAFASLFVCLCSAFQPALNTDFGTRALHLSRLQRRYASQVQERPQVKPSVDPLLKRSAPASTSKAAPTTKPTTEWASSPQALPWAASITGLPEDKLHYMPFLEWQLEHLQSFGGLKPLPMKPQLAFKQSDKKNTQIGSACFETPEFRKIRMTYVDGGKGMQVFNTVFYPRYDNDAPILGVDLLFFGGFKIMAIVDFQPLSKDQDYLERYTEMLRPIRARYPQLCETISNRYFEDTRWFSDHMLFGRLEDPSQIEAVVMPAFKEYLSTYTSMVRQVHREGRVAPGGREYVRQRHRDYDHYNHERDPASKMFEAHFGSEWAQEFMSSVLFELS